MTMYTRRLFLRSCKSPKRYNVCHSADYLQLSLKKIPQDAYMLKEYNGNSYLLKHWCFHVKKRPSVET